MKYSFMINIKMKENLDHIKTANILKELENTSVKYGIVKIDDETYGRLNTDNTDLGKAASFALNLSKRNNELHFVKIDDLVDNCSSRYL